MTKYRNQKKNQKKIRKILVTGAASPLGVCVCKEAKEKGFYVLGGVTKKHEKSFLKNVDKKIFFDLKNLEKFTLGKQHFFSVIHIAGISEGDLAELMQVNTTGTLKLLEKCRKKSISSFVHVSSMSVYGNVSKPTVNSKNEINSPCAYGLSKYIAERYCAAYFKFYKTVSVRVPAIVGPTAHRHFLARTLKCMQENHASVKVANPNFNFNNVVSYKGLGKFLVKLSMKPPKKYLALPVSSSCGIRIRSIIKLMIEKTKYRGRVQWIKMKGAFNINCNEAKKYGFRTESTKSIIKSWLSHI